MHNITFLGKRNVAFLLFFVSTYKKYGIYIIIVLVILMSQN